MALTPVTVIFDLVDGGDNPVTQGIGYLYPNEVVTDSTDNAVVTQKPIPINFYPSGNPTALLLPTDTPGLSPSGWLWTVVFKGDALPVSKTFHLLTAGGSTQYYSSLS